MENILKEELIFTIKELTFQISQKEKYIAALIVNNKELVLQYDEKDKCHDELLMAHNKLATHNTENEKRAAELVLSNLELINIKESQKVYINGLEKIMFMTSHKVRHPITNILGLADLLDHEATSPFELKEYLQHIKQSALKLDTVTKELTNFISTLGQKDKNKLIQ
jgi:signal transduction histidine kinase